MGYHQDLNSTSVVGTVCRSFVVFTGTGTVTIRKQFNVSSITDVNTGHYRVNLANANPNINYCCLATGTGGMTSGGLATLDTTSFGGSGSNQPNSTSSYQIRTVDGTADSGSGAAIDMPWVNSITLMED